MIPQIKSYLQDNWRKYFDTQPTSIQILLLSNPQGKKITHGKITNLIFINHNKIPTLVCKFLRTYEGAIEKLIDENLLLQALKSWGRTPEPFEQTIINGKLVTFEKYIPGISMKMKIQKKVNLLGMTEIKPMLEDIKIDFEKTAIILRELTNLKISYDNKINTYIDKAISDVNRIVNLLDLSAENKITISNICKNYKFDENQRVFVHCDLTPSNIIENAEGLKIIDFEFSTYSKHIFLDVYRFMFYYFHNLHELKLLPYREYDANFWYFFTGNTDTSLFSRNLVTAVLGDLSETQFLEYMSLFLLSNLQLQIDETDALSSHFINEVSSLLTLCFKLIKGETINTVEFGSIDPFSDMSKKELISELNHRQKILDEYAVTLRNKELELEKNNEYIDRCHETIKNKDIELGNASQYISQCHEVIEKKDRELSENVVYIQTCHETISNKDNEIKINVALNRSLEQEIEKRDLMLHECNMVIEQLKEELNKGFFATVRKKLGKGEK
ncbi:hypothetical protein ABEW19_00075 [Paenibacillus illinoisensis]|uniref:hypothetical protein n=1 Tax=Paenibacillus illinoisensis TaxID=59845 RepID=UPI003D2BF444